MAVSITVDEVKDLQVIDRPSVTRHAGSLVCKSYRRLPADEGVQVQQDEPLSRDAVLYTGR